MNMRQAIVALGMGMIGMAHADEYIQLNVAHSTIGFEYRQMNVLMDGRFTRFAGEIFLDPARPAQGLARFDIDLSSVDTGAPDVDAALVGPFWFHTVAYPRASFISTAILSAGPNLLRVSGVLSIKGRQRNVSGLVTFRESMGLTVLEGHLPIKRSDFAIGEGVWADVGTVANEITINFRLQVAAKPK